MYSLPMINLKKFAESKPVNASLLLRSKVNIQLMNKKRITTLILAFTMMASLMLTACGSKSPAVCFLTDLTWESSVDDMIAAEGEEFDSYASVYNGLTYIYPKTYQTKDGDIKYMFDDKGKLCNVAWSYEGETGDDVLEIYNQIVSSVMAERGEGENHDGVNTYGRVWKTDNGSIVISAVTTTGANFLQLSFMSKEVSK